MANSKEYKDLTEAASISDDALVAMAQPNAPELQTSKVSALAAKIQEINTDGPLAELELATSIGKQQLAEALTEKGVDTEASETLVQMADKVRNIEVDDSTENIYASWLIDPISSDIDTYYQRVFKHPISGDMIVTFGTKIYYVPYSDSFTSFADILDGASQVFDVTTIDSSYTVQQQNTSAYFGISEDFSKLLVPVNSSRNAHLVFDISANHITLLHTITHQFESNTETVAVSLSNDGKLMAFTTQTSYQFKIYSIENDTEYPCTVPGPYSQYGRAILLKNSNVYVVFSWVPHSYASRVPYSINDNAEVSYGLSETSADYYESYYSVGSSFWLHRPGESDEPIYMLSNIVSTDMSVPNDTAYHQLRRLYAYFNMGNLTGNTAHIVTPFKVLFGRDGYARIQLVALRAAIISWDGSRYTLNMPGLPALFIDPSNNTAEWDDPKDIYAAWSDEYSYQGVNMGIYSSLTTGVLITCQPMGYDPYAIGPVCKAKYTTTDAQRKILAKRRTINGTTVYYDPILSRREMLSVGYDQNTGTVPLPENETSEENN